MRVGCFFLELFKLEGWVWQFLWDLSSLDMFKGLLSSHCLETTGMGVKVQVRGVLGLRLTGQFGPHAKSP